MDRKIILIILGIILTILFVSLAARFIFGGPEDTWVCDHNGWVKHGNPTTPMPTTRCR